MKRIAVAVVSLLTAALVFVAAPAHADKPCHGVEIAELPGECLTQAVYDHIAALEAENADLRAENLDGRVMLNTLQDTNYRLRTSMWEQATVLQAARAEVSILRSDLTLAYDGLHWRDRRIKRLQAKVQELRAIVRSSV